MGQPMTMMTIAKKYDAVVSKQRRGGMTPPPSSKAVERDGSAFRKVIRESSHEESPSPQNDSPLKLRRRPSKKASTSTQNASSSHIEKTIPSIKRASLMSYKENPSSLLSSLRHQRSPIQSYNERTESDTNETYNQQNGDVTASRKMSRKTKNIIRTSEINNNDNNNNEHEFFKPIKKELSGHASTPLVNGGGGKINSRASFLNGGADSNTESERIPVIYEPSMSSSNDSLSQKHMSPSTTNLEKNNNRKNENRKKKISNSSLTSSSSDVEKKTTTTKKDFLSTNAQKKTSSYTPNIVEFDRSDMSSDSEPESTRNLSRRRLRSTLSRYSRSSIEEEQRRALQNKTPPLKEEVPANKPKRRRFGVSAEPVRVSWSTLRESLKTTEMDRTTEEVKNSNSEANNNNNADDSLNNTDTNTDTNQCENDGDEFSIQNKKMSVANIQSATQILKPVTKPTAIPIIEICQVESPADDEKPDTTNETQTEATMASENVEGKAKAAITDVVDVEKTSTDTTADTANTENDGEKSDLSPAPSPYQTPQGTPRSSPVPPPANTNSLQLPPTNIYNDRCPFPLSSVAPSELEKKYRTLVISYKTDQYTLPKRLENQERARDVAEAGMDKELCKLSTTIEELRRLRNTAEKEEAWISMLKQVEVLRKAAIKVSSQSEQHGSYQQEKRASPSIELIISYAENLRANVNKLEEELDRVKRNAPMSSSDELNQSNRRESKHLNGSVPTEIRNRAYTDVTHDTEEKTKVLNEKMRSQSIKDVSTALLSQRRTSKRIQPRPSLPARSRVSLATNRRDLSRVSFIEEAEYDLFRRDKEYDRHSGIESDPPLKRCPRFGLRNLRNLRIFDYFADNTVYLVPFILAIMLFGYFLITHIGILTGTNLKDIVVEYISYTTSFLSDSLPT